MHSSHGDTVAAVGGTRDMAVLKPIVQTCRATCLALTTHTPTTTLVVCLGRAQSQGALMGSLEPKTERTQEQA